MHIIIFDAFTFLAAVTALIFLIMNWRRISGSDIRILMTALFIFLIFYSFCLFVEWSGISKSLDIYEDFVGVLIPVTYAFLFYAFIRRKMVNDLRKSEENLSITLHSIGEGVIATDHRGRVNRLNQIAEKLTGWKLEDAAGKPLTEIFNIVNAKTMKPVENPVGKVIESGKIVGLANHTMLLSRNGSRCQIADAASPIKSSEGEIIGVVLVFRDVTGEYNLHREIAENEERMKLALHGADLGTWDWNIKTGEVKFNSRWAEMLGFKLDELESHVETWEKLVHPEDMPEIKASLTAHLKGKTDLYETEHRLKHKNGGWVWVLDRGRVIERDAEGKPIRACGTHLDITKRREMEKVVKVSEQKYRSLFEQSADGIFLHQLDGRIIDVNEAAVRQSGYSKEGLLNLTVFDLHTDKSTKESIMEQWRQWPPGRPTIIEDKHRRKDGSVYAVEINTGKVSLGKNELMLAIVRDITERKESEREYKQLINAMNDTAFVIDFDGRFVEFNDTAIEVLGYSREELLSMGPTDIDKKLTSGEIKNLIEKIKAGDHHVFETLHRTRDGREIPVEVSSSRVNYRGTSAILSVARDITERKRLGDQVRQIQKMEAIGTLAGGVAHDLNNLLSPIIGYGEMLQADPEIDDERHNLVKEILHAGTRARDLIRQLLAFSRKQTLEFKPININEIIKSFQRLLRRTVPEDIEIKLLLAPNLPAMMGDGGQIEQILMNLAVNASDAMPNGGKIIIETGITELDKDYVSSSPEMQPGSYIVLTVSDTGCGMDDETRERIFEPFFSTKGDRGTGLGMATVFGIVQQHKGSIWVYSEPGQGTTFKIHLPAAKDAQIEIESGDKPVTNLRGSETVLLVEDNEQVRNMAQLILKKQGYDVIVAQNSEEALSLLEAHEGRVDILLTDIVLPGMNGKELFDIAVQSKPQLKVLYMSGHSNDVIAHRGVLDEGIQFIQKPFSVQKLAAKMREVLDS